MHTEQDFEMMEMFNDPLLSGSNKKRSPRPKKEQRMGCGTQFLLFIPILLLFGVSIEIESSFLLLLSIAAMIALFAEDNRPQEAAVRNSPEAVDHRKTIDQLNVDEVPAPEKEASPLQKDAAVATPHPEHNPTEQTTEAPPTP